MPAINALLPIVAASSSQKENTQNRATEYRADAAKSAANAVTKGLEQEAAAQKRMEQKRFINAYEEGIQEQGREQERRAQRVAASELIQRDDAAALAASGSALPPVGEPLPAAGVPTLSATHIAIDSDAPPSQEPSTPVVHNPEPAKQPAAAPTPSIDQQQQQAAAEAFHTLVSAENGKADEKAILQQGIVSAASLQASPQALDSAQQGTTNTPSQGEEGVAATPQALQSAASFAATLASTDATLGGEEPDQTQLLRAWRGLDGQQLRSATTAATQATQAAQVARQDPVAAWVPIALSGQIQQFAQSLRLAGDQPDAALRTSTAVRGAASAQVSSAELSPLRADSTSANSLTSPGRAIAVNTPFAQSMQASNFGQPLGEAVGQNAWGESIAQRVSLMAGLKVSSAQIQLDPPELGAMTVKVSVNGDQASVSFHSPHAMVRDALELSFPRLQEMMGQQGLQLVDAQVSDNSSAKQGAGESASGRAAQPQGEAADDGSGNASPQIVQIATGLIDFYA